MNPIFSQTVINTILRHRKKAGKQRPSTYDPGRDIHEAKVILKRFFKDVVLITAGIFSASFGLKGFLLPNRFIDGGATGISLLIAEVANFPLSILLALVNLPFVILGFRVIGRNFGMKAALAICGLALVVASVPFPQVTQDKLLIAVFGGFFLGTGIGLSVRGGAVLDGTEVLAIFISRRTNLTIGDIIFAFNVIIFSFAAYLLSVESALYSILIYLAASKTVDFIIEGIEEYTGITVVSDRSEEIRRMVIDVMGRGVTIYKGRRGYGKTGEHNSEIDIIYTVITRLEINKLNTEIEKIDPNAFVIMSSIKDTKGGMIKKRPLKD